MSAGAVLDASWLFMRDRTASLETMQGLTYVVAASCRGLVPVLAGDAVLDSQGRAVARLPAGAGADARRDGAGGLVRRLRVAGHPGRASAAAAAAAGDAPAERHRAGGRASQQH